MDRTDAPPRLLQDAVHAAFPEYAGAAWLPLRGGRINRLWRVRALVIKYYPPDAGSLLFPNDPEAEAAALRHLAPLGLAPVLRHFGQGWLAYDHFEGQPWNGGDAAGIARTLAAVHARNGGSFRQVASGSAALLEQARHILAGCRGHLPDPPEDSGIAAVDPCLIHGDAVAGNILCHQQRTMLIDWQCPARGDPAEDLAMFLSPAMQFIYRGKHLTPEEESCFLAGYPATDVVDRYLALRPMFRWRMAAHCLWRAERGDAGYQTALRLELG